MSVLKSAVMLHCHSVRVSEEDVLPSRMGKEAAHQHRRYDPPALDSGMEPQVTVAPLLATFTKNPILENLGRALS
jgi:hypothetical protein